MISVPDVPLRHQQLIVTLYGLYGREVDGSFPVSVLIALLGDLGHDAPGVRSSVSRLKAKGVLHSVRTDRGPGYEISPEAMEIFTAGDERIFSSPRSVPGDPWVLAIFSVPESQRNRRHQLRTELAGLGFGMVSAGVWIAPAHVRDEAQRRLESRGLGEFVEFFTGEYGPESDMRAKVTQWWDLEAIDTRLGQFLELYGDALEQWISLLGPDPVATHEKDADELRREAFRYYVPLLTLWRRFPYRDPGLPLDYLPLGWKGTEAQAVFQGVHRLIGPLAAEHARSLIGVPAKSAQLV
ncbi:PaaX family transcriptional regulator C-terminal domain-containing protein [Kocuria marina]|uniref:PaaX family transcriptional regulator n=1 Tax=Kocuria marina TaxID=223184 RepID=UPI0034608419